MSRQSRLLIREAEEEIGVKLTDVVLKTTIFLVEKDYFDNNKKFYALELFFVQDLDNHEPLNK